MAALHISAETTELLRRQILDGTFPAGSQLPSERVLSGQLGISRTALRDALQALETSGLVEVHVGRGRFVARDVAAGHSAAAAMRWVYMHRQDLESLNEVRGLLEPRAVETMPAARAADIAKLASEIVDRQVQAVRLEDFDTAARLDSEFHALLAAETPNVPLRVLTKQLIAMADTHARAVYQVPGAAENSIAQHEAIVTALASSDVARAATLIREHARTASRFALDLAKPETDGSAPADQPGADHVDE
ncbi:FadR/GntR family transcriptional regulator [Phytoactinopolyspora limicola]|uniref:FadR/GntR family transcriptional regulator n=1 Tax=Phytoactinopolyspora limicola TaxID=2715536 RepID=UPI001408A69E|nr:GntR family transcriptional regulator [Phytoactinopolyspora limicola]